jgi:hypothetical protein
LRESQSGPVQQGKKARIAMKVLIHRIDRNADNITIVRRILLIQERQREIVLSQKRTPLGCNEVVRVRESMLFR